MSIMRLGPIPKGQRVVRLGMTKRVSITLNELPEIALATEVAAVLRYSPAFVYKLVREGELQGFGSGRLVRIRRQSVIDYIEGASCQSATRASGSNGGKSVKPGKSSGTSVASDGAGLAAQRIAEKLKASSRKRSPKSNPPADVIPMTGQSPRS